VYHGEAGHVEDRPVAFRPEPELEDDDEPYTDDELTRANLTGELER
jgi:hypothetical protein